MNQIIKAGALVCALAMLEWNAAAVAEEKRLGDYIYVPAMSAPGSVGTISLRVEGVTAERLSLWPGRSSACMSTPATES